MSRSGGTVDATTLPGLLRARVAATPASAAYVAEGPDRRGHTVSWNEFGARVSALAASLHAADLQPGDRVGILAPTSVDWEVAQHASLACGAVVAGLDPNYPDAQLAEIVRDVSPAVLFAADSAALARVGSSAARKFNVTFGDGDASASGAVRALGALVRSGAALSHPLAAAEAGAIITFSSGTTGRPKPIVYSHAQVREAIRAVVGAFPDVDSGTRLLCWLPLANLFQRMINFCAIATGAVSHVVGDPRDVMSHMRTARPHLFIGVPRFFERVHAAIMGRIETAPLPVRASLRWALRRGAAPGGVGWRLADRLVLARLRAAFGGEIRYLVSGSAPMPRWMLDWFDAIGLPVYEAYGVSEDVVPVAMNRPGARRLGSVGRPLSSNEVRLAVDGEIRVRGPGVFTGYLGAGPDAPRPDADGFWATGDLGALDAEGYLTVSGRKADNFKTSTGRWIVPTRIEQRLGRVPYVLNALAVGAGRKAVAALLCVDGVALASRARRAAAGAGPDVRGAEEAETESVRADVLAACDGLSAHERPAAVVVTTDAFTIAGGELTTNLKVRRGAVESKYAAALERVYADLARGGGSSASKIPVRRA